MPTNTRSTGPKPRNAMPRSLVTWAIAAAITCGIILGGVSIAALWRHDPPAPTLDSAAITWPSTGTAAVMVGSSVATSTADDAPRPMGSIAKLITALVVLDTLPLQPGMSGPMFQLTDADAQRAQADLDRGGSGIPIPADSSLSARELLEHMLVASSNGHALVLVDRIFGSESAYAIAARNWLAENDLSGIEIVDATGISPADRATARDLLKLGSLASEHPVIAEIVRMPGFATRDGFGVRATNNLLGTLGVDGLKTGYTAEAGYTVLFSITGDPDTEPIIGVVLGSPSDAQRTTDVTRLVASARALEE